MKYVSCWNAEEAHYSFTPLFDVRARSSLRWRNDEDGTPVNRGIAAGACCCWSVLCSSKFLKIQPARVALTTSEIRCMKIPHGILLVNALRAQNAQTDWTLNTDEWTMNRELREIIPVVVESNTYNTLLSPAFTSLSLMEKDSIPLNIEHTDWI